MTDDDKPDADDIKSGEGTTASKDWSDVHDKAMKEYHRGYEHDRRNSELAYADLAFLRGLPEDQWTPEAMLARNGRPVHVVNKLPQFIRQVTGDMRQMRPSIKVVPVDSQGDIKTAEVLGGLIRYVENRSYASHIYTAAGDSQVAAGIGHWGVDIEIAQAGSFDREIRVVGIDDGVAVVWDADAVMPTREDANHCFVPSDMSREAFKERWPDATADSFDINTMYGESFNSWQGDDFIRVAKYWKKKPFKRLLCQMPDGTVEDMTEQLGHLKRKDIPAAAEWFKANQGANLEQHDSYKVCRYLMTAGEILEEQEWAGMNIPVVPVIGEEIRVGRSVYRFGIVRNAKDLQRMVNYYASAETEVIALQPKAPWIGTKKQFEQHYDLWETANTDNHPFLEYTPDPQAGGPPQRIQPPVASQAIQQGALNAANDMKAVIGIYDSALGAKSNETSGIAIQRRDRQSDTGTFVYQANFALAIQRTGQIVAELIPGIYDTQRTIRILGDDGKSDMATVNNPKGMDANGQPIVEHDLSSGTYDVMMEQGPSYSTKREEARDGMTAFIAAVPMAAGLIGDLYAKNQDWPQAEEIGERLQEMLPPPVKAKIDADKQKREQANNPQQGPTPEQQQQIAAQQHQQQIAQAAEQMQLAEAKAKVDEAQAKVALTQAQTRKANADADKAEVEAEIKKAEFGLLHVRTAMEADDHLRGDQHEKDRHEADMVTKALQARQGLETHGLAAQREMQGMEQSAEQHGMAMQSPEQPEQPTQ